MNRLMKTILIIIAVSIVTAGCTTINRNTKEVIRIDTNDKVKIPVLMYHHFDENKENIDSAVVHTQEFESQMKYLKENGYTAITSQDLIDYKSGTKVPPQKPILITADDGYLSNYTYMYPILKQNNLKATVFLLGERIERVATKEESAKLDWNKVREMYESGVIDFQSHTYDSHNKTISRNTSKGEFSVPVIGESKEEYIIRIDKDIKRSIKRFEDNLGYKPIAFSYPYGEYSYISEKVLKDNGIKLSFTIKDGFVDSKGERYLLNRITIKGSDDLDTFIKKINN